MSTLYTKIFWNLHNYCRARCSYCPTRFWNGIDNKNIDLYLEKVYFILKHFESLGYVIEWTFDGGEPLEIAGFPKLLKVCKENNGKITLNTNGGYQWLDWWAIEPNVDCLNLTYHYWQNFNLVKYIIQSFEKNNKNVNILAPVRPDYFDEDLNRIEQLEKETNLKVNKIELYKDSSQTIGMYEYTNEQLFRLKGQSLVDHAEHLKNTSFAERTEHEILINPSFTGKSCNTGIERLYISHDGWVSGSNCNNTHLGNIWQNISLPISASICKMQSCVNSDDQQITKFL